MINIGRTVLEQKNFPDEKESNILTLHKKVKNGSLGISLSSFEEIFNLTPKKQPFPIGTINFEDKKSRFVFSWVDDFSSLNINNIEEYTIRVRNYPTKDYPVISLILGINIGKVDPKTNEDLWYYGEALLNISFMTTRIKLYQFLNSDEVLFCLFDNNVENLDSFGFSLNKEEQKLLLDEIESVFEITNNMDLTNHIRDFAKGVSIVDSGFNHNGLPKSKVALDIYLARKSLLIKPNKHNWNDYLSI